MVFLESLFDYALMMVLWLVCVLPVVTVGPATCAYYRAGFARKERPGTPVMKTFFTSFRRNLRQSILPGLFLTACAAALVSLTAWAFFSDSVLSSMPVRIACLGSGFCLFLMFFYGLSLLAMFENSLVQTLRNAVIIGLTHPVRTLGMFAFTLLIFYGILLYVPLAVFLLPGLGAAVINALWPVYRDLAENS